MTQMENIDAKAVLDSFLKQQNIKDKDIALKPLLGGRSGAGLFIFELNSTTYVLRLFADMEVLSGRKRESKVTQAVAKFGFAPKVFYVDPDYKGMIIEFLPGHTLLPNEAQKPKNIKLFAAFLKKLHQLNIEDLTADGYFKRAWSWLEAAQKNQDCFPTGMDRLLTAVKNIEQTVSHYEFPRALIHSDLISRNIMFDGKDFRLVDWPAAGYGNPYWDFIDFVDYQSFNESQTRLFFDSYFEREVTQEEWDLFVVLRPVPSIVRLIGGFAFMPDVKSKAFYDVKREEQSLVTFKQLVNDFALDRMDVEHWEVTMAFLLEAERQLDSEAFKSSYKRLN